MAWVAAGVLIAYSGRARSDLMAPRCRLQITNVDRDFARREVFNNSVNVNYDAGGNVRMQCVGQKVTLRSDSISALSGNYYRLYGHVVYDDSTYRFAADTMIYVLNTEMLHAGGHVVVTDKAAGSTLTGPYVDYYRQVKGVNDSARVDAFMRPTVRYFTRKPAGDTSKQSPYILVGAHLRGFGQSRLTADSAVTFDRDSLHAAGDSLAIDRGKTTLVLLTGKPGHLRRRGADSFYVAGREIRFRLEDDKLRELRSFLDARVVRGTTTVTGDTVAMAFTADKLDLTLAWNRKTGATIQSGGYDVHGDSVAVDTPGEQLREIRLFNHGSIMNPRDTTVHFSPRFPGDTAAADTTRNTLWGERVTARFAQTDSAGQRVTRLNEVRAFGKGVLQARSLFMRAVTARDGRVTPSINYTRADTIFMRMKSGDSSGLAAVQAYGKVYGAQLESLSLPKTKADSAKLPIGTGRP
jgi:hypothetical protein